METLIPSLGAGLDKDWSRLQLAVCGSVLLEMSLLGNAMQCDDKFRINLSHKITGSMLRLKTLGTILLNDLNNKKRTIDETRFLFTQICLKTFYCEKDFTTRSLSIIYKIIFWVPFIATTLRKVLILKNTSLTRKNYKQK